MSDPKCGQCGRDLAMLVPPSDYYCPGCSEIRTADGRRILHDPPPKPRKRARMQVTIELLRKVFHFPDDVEVVDVGREGGDFPLGTVSFYLAGEGLPEATLVPPGGVPVVVFATYESRRVEEVLFKGFTIPDPPVPNPKLDAQIDAAMAKSRARAGKPES